MILCPTYRYVSIDFETTGLDTQKDEIIQVGIVSFDYNGKQINSFSSYIKPQSDTGLTTIVRYVTGIEQKDLQNAPAVGQIQKTVGSFFGGDVIIVGHNVDFDIDFLKRFFPDVTYAGAIDTYSWAQNCIHFPPSFALEVLCQHLYEYKPLFENIYTHFLGQAGDDAFHDALYDAKAAAALFVYIAQHIQQLLQTYPQLQAIRERVDSPLLYGCIQYTKIVPTSIVAMPILQKVVTTPQRMIKKSDTPNIDMHPSGTQLYIGNMSPHDVATLIAQQKNIVCAFSHKSKADIIKHHLHDIGVYGIASLYDETYFAPKRFELFMQKKQFSLEEAMFLTKYLSHHNQGLGILDIQQEYEKHILYFLQEKKSHNKAPIIFATHTSLYHHIKKNPGLYTDYTICFFDSDRWYTTYNDFASHAYNPTYFLQQLEKIVYTYDVCYQVNPTHYKEKYDLVQKLYSFVQVFVGVLFIETQHIHQQQGGAYIQLDPPLYHHAFFRTQKLWERMIEQREAIRQILPDDVVDDIVEHIDTLQHLLSSLLTVQKRDHIFYGSAFIYKEANRYIQRDEFNDYFATARRLFLSIHDTKVKAINNHAVNRPKLSHLSLNTLDKAIVQMQSQTYTYIISTNKQLSKELFDKLYDANLHKTHTIVAENITGGAGKNIFISQHADKAIIIGGYSFFLQVMAKRLDIDKTLVFFIKGAMEKLLLGDIQWYGNQG